MGCDSKAPEAVAVRYCLDDQVGYLLRLASQRHAAVFQQRIPEDLTPPQFSTLIRLSEHGEVSQNHLGRLSAIDIATIKGVVDRLREKGLIQARADPEDRRRSLLSLSPKGAGLIARLEAVGLEITAQTLTGLGPDEQETLVRLLRKIS